MNRRTRTLIVGALPIVALAAVMSTPAVTVPFASEGPGPLFDVLGEVEGETAVEVSGGDPDPSEGRLDMTTVAISHNLSLLQVMGMWADPGQVIVPIESVFPPGVSQDEVQERNALMFTDSEANATAAALSQLGLPIEVAVAMIAEDAAAADAANVSADDIVDGEVIDDDSAAAAAAAPKQTAKKAAPRKAAKKAAPRKAAKRTTAKKTAAPKSDSGTPTPADVKKTVEENQADDNKNNQGENK